MGADGRVRTTKINDLRIVEADDGDNRMVDSIRGQLFTAIFGAAIQVPENEQPANDDSDEVDGDDDDDDDDVDDNADPGDWRKMYEQRKNS
jgi:hypothetical protein